MAALTEVEARTRAGLLDVDSYEVFLDLTVQPVRSRTETRFRCREPGAASFADLAAGSVLGAVLNGRRLDPPVDGRLALPGLGADNVLTAEAEVAWSRSGQGLTSFTDPADGAAYVTLTCYPSSAPGVFCCFDQSDLTATMTLSVALPGGWECIANGPVTHRPPEGRPGLWQFAPVPAMAPCEVALCAGPLVTDWHGDGGGGHVAMTVRRRRSLGGADGLAGLGTFGELSRRAIGQYERLLGVPCAFPKYDIVAVPDLAALAESMPGLMLVNESLLARMIDPDDDKVAIVAAHEVAHLWFGCLVGARWWDDVWLDEAMATYLCYTIMSDPVDAGTPDMAGPWTAFCYRHELAAYRADELPGAEPVSAPVASATEALAKPPAITYHKGAAVIRQLAALIGDDALHGGLGDYLTRYRASGVAALDDLIACLSRASGRDLAGWADEWLRTEGASALRPELTAAPDGTIGSLAVTQDRPRTQLIGIGLYDLDGTRLRRRQVVHAEVGGERTPVPSLAGEKLPDAVVLNDGDLSYTRVRFDERTLRTLAAAAMDVGDPLTEAVCWTAAWQLVIAAELAAADFADLVIRRLAGPALTGPPSAGPPIPGLPLVGVETLLERAVECADVYAPPADRAAIRERVAGTVLELTERTPAALPGGRPRNHGPPCPGERPAPVTTAGTIQEPAGNATIRATARPVHGSRRWQRVSPPARTVPASLTCCVPGCPATCCRMACRSPPTCGPASCSPCPPADSPTTAISTRWPLPTPSPASSTVPPAAPCARIPPARKPPGRRRSPTIRTCGWRRRTRAACGWQVRRTSWPATVTGTSPKRCRRWRTGNPERRAASRGCCTRPRSSHRPRSRPPTRRFRLGIPAGSFGSSSRSSRQSCVQHSRHGQLPGGSSCRDHRPMPMSRCPVN